MTETQIDMSFAKSIVEAVEQGCTYEDRCLAVRDLLAAHRTNRTDATPVAVEMVAELQLSAFLAGRGSIRTKANGNTHESSPGPTMDDYRRMARFALAEGWVDATPVARKQFPILGSRGAKIDLQLVEDHGKQVYSNHYQTVERLAERGGLSWCELHAVLNNRAWQKMDGNTAIAECRAIEARYLGAFNPPATDVAALVDAAKDLRDAIAHMAAPARVDPDKYFSEQVKAFGDAFGYGALMTTASALWRQSLGDLQGGEFAVGPCVTTAANQLNRLSAALAPFTKGQNDDA